MNTKILGLSAAEVQEELHRIAQHCQWTVVVEKENQLVLQTESGELILTWSPLPPQKLGSFHLPRTQLSITGPPTALARLDEALRCLRAGG
ncbi:MAG: hypothetical protein ACOY3H_04075 [Bacillota bacterium]